MRCSLFLYGKLWWSSSQIKGQVNTDEALNDSLNEVSVFHPEHAFTAAVSHELVTQVLRPVGPLVWPRAVPGEPAPGVPQTQQPEHNTRSAPDLQLCPALLTRERHVYCSVMMSARVARDIKTTHFLVHAITWPQKTCMEYFFCSLHNSMNYFHYMQSSRSVTVHKNEKSLVLKSWFGTFSGIATKPLLLFYFSLNSGLLYKFCLSL